MPEERCRIEHFHGRMQVACPEGHALGSPPRWSYDSPLTATGHSGGSERYRCFQCNRLFSVRYDGKKLETISTTDLETHA